MRRKSETGIYHTMLRGVNQQQIFYEDEDYNKFLSVVKDCKMISGFELYAYCLMGNHIHLLIKEGDEPLDLTFKRFGSRFVYWYNTKYKRVGHLFQDRYKSEPVVDDAYLLSVLRYIHNNPIKGNIAKKLNDYKYSSYNCYFKNNEIIDRDVVLGILPIEEFEKFHKSQDFYNHIDIDSGVKTRITDEEAIRIILKKTRCKSVEEFLNLPVDKRKRYIAEFKNKGMSVRQLSRLTGLSKSLIQRI